MRELSKRIAAMSDDERNELAKRINPTTVEGHTLSAHNACLLVMQYPSVTLVGGFRQWKTHGRYVSSGPGSGLAIWIPLKRKAKDDNGETYDTDDKPGFTLASVFDVSQTSEFSDATDNEPLDSGPLEGELTTREELIAEMA